MKMSQERVNAAYKAIHDVIMDTRIALSKDGLSAKHDVAVAQLEMDIWQRLKTALNIQEPHP